jgi:hypothetical protein
MKMSFTKIAIATTTLTCATLFSFGWSEQRGASLSIESAQARIGRPLTPVSVAGVARRNYRRAAYGYGAGVVGAGVAAAAIGTAAVAATAPGYYGTGYYGRRAYAPAAYYGDPANSYAYAGAGPGYVGGYYGSSPWGFYECQPGYIYGCRHLSELGNQ